MFTGYRLHPSLKPLAVVLLAVAVLTGLSLPLAAQDPRPGLTPENLTVIVREGSPAPVLVTLDTVLPDGCTQVGEVQQTVEGEVVTFEIAQTRLSDPFVACTQALRPVTVVAALDLTGLPAGDYTVQAGDLSSEITLTQDLLDDATCYAQPDATISDEAAAETEMEAPASPYVNLLAGYCLHVPAGYGLRVEDTIAGVIPLPQADDDATDPASSAPATSTPAAVLTLDFTDLTTLGTDPSAEPLPVEPEDGSELDLNGTPGLLFEAIPGYEGEQFVVVQVAERQVVISDRGAEADLWDAVLGSLRFFEPFTPETDGLFTEGQPQP